jgi:quercetin dioxygenase-like cupin family protein
VSRGGGDSNVMTTDSSPECPVSSWAVAHEIQSVHEEAVQKHGRVTRTLLKSAEVRVLVVGMARGVTWPEHKAAGRVVIRVEHGCIEMHTNDRRSQFAAGMLVALEPGEPHDVLAVEDSAVLLFVSG